ncbi:MAG TPA: hypothetical protein VFA59_23155 [Vicinamibacterales bacterium]|nr:hypothetical protein [Vicinamibacterales bacterium]
MRRRLFQLFVVGCVVSLIVSGRLTLRLILGGMLGWAIVPVVDAIVGVDVLPKPLLLWIVAIAAFASFLSPLQAERFSSNYPLTDAVIVVAIALAFLPTPRATWTRRAIAYVILTAFVFGFAGWPIVSRSPW